MAELKCEACNITFENEEEMKNHAKEAHGGDEEHDHGGDHEHEH